MALAGFLILVGAAMPSAYEGADLTTLERAPIKMAAGEEPEEMPVEEEEEPEKDVAATNWEST